ncbi:MAG: hypoxanthine phosphoribosyltransferase [Acutalibacteraceae bacterium]|nr:hypoxanthine phosphoribosyltransferase [Acutalibacteraceae bacterium]
MLKDIERVLFSEKDIQEMVERIGKQISEDYKGRNLLIVCVLKGSVCFMSDLMRAVTIPCKIDFVEAKSYGSSTVTSGVVNISRDLNYDLTDYDIILVEDIFDSGRTLERLTGVFESRNPRSVACCSLLDKPERRDPNVKLKLKYTGSEVPDAFVVGYGLDYDEYYRNLPFVGILKPEVYSK